jgi:hypothetical protein
VQLLRAFPSAFKGSVDFGPEVTSSDKSLKVLLNAEDKVRVWVCPDLLRTAAQRLGSSPGQEAKPLGGSPID